MIWSLLSWLSQHPAQVITIVVTVAATSYVVGLAVYAVACAHEQRREAEKRQRFEALIELSCKAQGKVGAPGFPRKRVG